MWGSLRLAPIIHSAEAPAPVPEGSGFARYIMEYLQNWKRNADIENESMFDPDITQ